MGAVSRLDNISIPSLILVSFPEAILTALLGILSIGKSEYLNKKYNILRILLYAIISSTSIYFIRRNVSNEIENIVVNIFLSSLLFIFIVRFKFYESILAVLFGFIITIVAEIAFLPIFTITGMDVDAVRNTDYLRFLVTLPIRFLEIFIFIIGYRYKIRIIDIEGTAVKKREYYIQLIVYMLSIGTLVFLGILMAKISLVDQNNIVASTAILLRLNIYLSLFVTVVLTLTIRNTHEFYKNKTSLSNNEFLQNLEYISDLIEQMNYSEAQEAVESLKTHINKQ
ncbi:MAG: hypothetical protein N2645_19705 [Clostridia bacterium]|nr:hypothetical protein [Clostridia bacterium]